MKNLYLKYFAELMIQGGLFIALGVAKDMNDFSSKQGILLIASIAVITCLYYLLRKGPFEADDEFAKENILKAKARVYELISFFLLITGVIFPWVHGDEIFFGAGKLLIIFGASKILEFVLFMYYERR